MDDETAASALEEVDDDDEAERRGRSSPASCAPTRGLDRDKRMARLAGMLARKGYPSGLAMAVVREALDADAAATGHPERD